jgi:arylsulfatase A-like enzyme
MYIRKLLILATISGIILLNSVLGTENSKRPNIVFILADDMSYDSVSAYNSKMGTLRTPNIDRLVEQGMSFTDAHSGSSVCSPTRYGIMTGRYAWRTRLKTSVLWEWGRPLIEDERLTVAELLQQHGYRTGMVGKWHLGMHWQAADGSLANKDLLITDASFRGDEAKARLDAVANNIDFSKPIRGGPVDHGFDYYFGVDVPNFPPYIWIQNDRLLGMPSDPKPDEMFGRPGPMLPGWKLETILPTLAEKAAEWITAESKSSEPFFLYLPLTSPHAPISPSPVFKGKSGISDYADFLMETDWVVGQVMQALEEAGVNENTLLIFTTDNGTADKCNFNEMESHGIDFHNHFRGHKAQIYEGGHRVPFIVRWPGKAKARSTCDETVCLNDFMATTAELVGESLQDDTAEDSTSLLPLILGKKTQLINHPSLVNHDISGRFAIRDDGWKLIPPRGNDEKDTVGELYDLHSDPKETTNLFDKNHAVVKKLNARLRTYIETGRSTSGSTQQNDGEPWWEELPWPKSK